MPNSKNFDIAQTVTDNIIEQLEQGSVPWQKPWKRGVGSNYPKRHNGLPYMGINTVLLWTASMLGGFTNTRWMTFKQCQALGGQVKKGSRSTMVVYYGTAQDRRFDNDDDVYRFIKYFRVFNVEQIEGLPEVYMHMSDEDDFLKEPEDGQLKRFFDKIGGTVRHGGDRAFYVPSADYIQMPYVDAFQSTDQYFATLAHEYSHWTGHKSRLSRKFGSKFGSRDYAFEELVAEISSAMIGAHIDLPPGHFESHAAYIQNWLEHLKNDKRYIFKAAAQAQYACDYILKAAGFDQQADNLPIAA